MSDSGVSPSLGATKFASIVRPSAPIEIVEADVLTILSCSVTYFADSFALVPFEINTELRNLALLQRLVHKGALVWCLVFGVASIASQVLAGQTRTK